MLVEWRATVLAQKQCCICNLATTSGHATGPPRSAVPESGFIRVNSHDDDNRSVVPTVQSVVHAGVIGIMDWSVVFIDFRYAGGFDSKLLLSHTKVCPLTSHLTSETFYTHIDHRAVFVQPVRIVYVFLPVLLILEDVPSVFFLQLRSGTNYPPLSGSPTHWIPLNAD